MIFIFHLLFQIFSHIPNCILLFANFGFQLLIFEICPFIGLSHFLTFVLFCLYLLILNFYLFLISLFKFYLFFIQFSCHQNFLVLMVKNHVVLNSFCLLFDFMNLPFQIDNLDIALALNGQIKSVFYQKALTFILGLNILTLCFWLNLAKLIIWIQESSLHALRLQFKIFPFLWSLSPHSNSEIATYFLYQSATAINWQRLDVWLWGFRDSGRMGMSLVHLLIWMLFRAFCHFWWHNGNLFF